MARRKGPGPSQADLAAALGLSVSTVSRALSGSPDISEPVKRRVSETADRFGYRTRPPAARSGLERIVVIATLHDVNSTLAWVYQEMLAGLNQAAQQIAVPLETHMTAETERIPAAPHAGLTPASGLVFLGLVPNASTIASLRENEIPAVIVNGVDPSLQVDSVSPANYFGGRMIAEHLANVGHRKVAFIGGASRWTLTRRLHGFRDRLQEIHGCDQCVVDSIFLQSDTSRGHLAHLADWLPQCLDRASAIFCYNDSVALSTIEAVSSLGRSIPDDVSIIGFDDMPLATMNTPKLTTFRVDWQAIGSEAVRYLERRHANPVGAAREMQIGGQLISRQSVGPPRPGAIFA